jgi:hypothetical protein
MQPERALTRVDFLNQAGSRFGGSLCFRPKPSLS